MLRKTNARRSLGAALPAGTALARTVKAVPTLIVTMLGILTVLVSTTDAGTISSLLSTTNPQENGNYYVGQSVDFTLSATFIPDPTTTLGPAPSGTAEISDYPWASGGYEWSMSNSSASSSGQGILPWYLGNLPFSTPVLTNPGQYSLSLSGSIGEQKTSEYWEFDGMGGYYVLTSVQYPTATFTAAPLNITVLGVQGRLSLTTSGFTLRAMRDSGRTTGVTLSETSGTGGAWFNSSLGGDAAIDLAIGLVVAGGTQSLNLGWSDYTTIGPRAGSVTLINTGNQADPFNASGNVIGMTGAVVDNRVVVASTTNFGAIHVGSAVAQTITLSTTGDDNHFTRVSVGNVGPDANGISVTGGVNPVFNGSTVIDMRTLSGVLNSIGAINGAITLPTTGEGLLGEAPINVPVNYVAQVFSGKAQWNLANGASWGSNGNWADTQPGGPNAGAPGISGFLGDTATFGNSTGSSDATVSLNGVNPTLSAITFSNTSGGSFILAQGSGGTLTLSNTPGNATINVSEGSHLITTPITLATTTDVSVTNPADMLTIGGTVAGTGGLNKCGAGTLVLGGNNTYSGGTTVRSGTLQCNGFLSASTGQVNVEPLCTLVADASIQRPIAGIASNSQIVANTANVSLGDSTSYTGFNHAGTLTVGSNIVTLDSAGFANLGVLTTLGGGTLAAPNGVTIPLGGNLVGSGAVNGKIAAGYGSTINATGNLTLGDSTSPVGFVSDGELHTNANTVTLNSGNGANNPNAVVLGSLTQIAGGSLVSPNGIVLDTGNNLVATNAGGTVRGGSASRFLNDGNVQGPSASSGNWLTFNLLFKGSTGQTSGQIDFAGGFATGDCPGVNTQYGNTKLGGPGTEFDIGGTTPGDADNDYGQLNVLSNSLDPSDHGDLILSSSTSFKIVDWNGFVPIPGEDFTVLTWSGTLSGMASLAVDPAFAADGIQFVSQWNSNSLVVEAVPEPGTFALLAAGAIGLAAYGLRWASALESTTNAALAPLQNGAAAGAGL